MILARKVIEKIGQSEDEHSSMVQLPESTTSKDDIEDAESAPGERQREATIELHMQRKIPYKIPPSYLSAIDKDLQQDEEDAIVTFEPRGHKCERCKGPLGESMFQQGTNSRGGNGYLFSHKHSFMRINIKIKKCKNPVCRATNTAFPIEEGRYKKTSFAII